MPRSKDSFPPKKKQKKTSPCQDLAEFQKKSNSLIPNTLMELKSLLRPITITLYFKKTMKTTEILNIRITLNITVKLN